MNGKLLPILTTVGCFFIGMAFVPVALPGLARPIQTATGNSNPAAAEGQGDSSGAARLARGKKLMLKDGNFQLVRSYERKGDRVKYFSVERAAWEEIPASLVDWEATARVEAETNTSSEALVKKIQIQEEAQRIDTVMDVDASLQVAPGVFLPPGEGMFLIEGRSVTPLEQASSDIKVDRKRKIQQMISPIPIVPGKHYVELTGAKAKIRIQHPVIEFYLREAPPDSDQDSAIRTSSRPGQSGPELELIRATVKGNKRQLETIRSVLGQEISQERTSLSLQQWQIAPTVYRFTLSEPLPPGEYALAEILTNGMNLFVWDFGFDGETAGKVTKK